MARTVAALPAGARITDYISLGVITRTFPLATVRAVLAASGKASPRERDLPAQVVVCYVIARRFSCRLLRIPGEVGHRFRKEVGP